MRKSIFIIGMLIYMNNAFAGSPPSDQWDHLARRGKGVCIAKIDGESGVRYIFFSDSDRVQLPSALLDNETSFDSIKAACEFIKYKPEGVALMEAGSATIRDEEGIVSKLSEEEKSMMGIDSLEGRAEGGRAKGVTPEWR